MPPRIKPPKTKIQLVQPDDNTLLFLVPGFGWTSLFLGIPFIGIAVYFAYDAYWVAPMYGGGAVLFCILDLFLLNSLNRRLVLQATLAPVPLLTITSKSWLRTATHQWRPDQIKDLRVMVATSKDSTEYYLEVRVLHGWNKTFLRLRESNELAWIRGTLADALHLPTVEIPVSAII